MKINIPKIDIRVIAWHFVSATVTAKISAFVANEIATNGPQTLTVIEAKADPLLTGELDNLLDRLPHGLREIAEPFDAVISIYADDQANALIESLYNQAVAKLAPAAPGTSVTAYPGLPQATVTAYPALQGPVE